MNFHKFPLAMIIYVLCYATLIYINKSGYEGINKFKDAITYSVHLTASIHATKYKPIGQIPKLLTSLQLMTSFVSLYKFILVPETSFNAFLALNTFVIIIIGIMQYSFDKHNIDVDRLYQLIKTHTLYEANEKYPNINLIHIFIVINIVFSLNGGVFQYISDSIFGHNLIFMNRVAKIQ